MADWIKTRRQHDGTFLLVLARHLPDASGNDTTVEDFRSFRSPLEFANAVLTAHGVEPAFVFWAAANPPNVGSGEQLNAQSPNCDGHHATEAPMPPLLAETLHGWDDDEGEVIKWGGPI